MSNFNNVFISYGRAESKAFAKKLHDNLCEQGYDVWFDQNDIPLGVDFQNQIDEGIEKADVFVFIIAPHAVRSVYCRKEIELAVKRGKRIVPILQIEPTDDETWQQLHPAIGKINWVYMRQEWQKDIPQEDYKTIDNYEEAFEGLWNLVEKNKEYVRKHTEILDKALNWETHNNDSHLLLVGKERQEAEEWLLTEFKNQQPPCQPSELHTDYLCESRKNAENLLTDCFISYSSQDKEEREHVRLALARHLITTWTHNRDIVKGEEFDKAIERGIEGADNFLFFITKDSIVSEYCLFELEYAIKLNKRIIPLLIEEVPIKEFPTQIKNLQYIDFTDNIITEVTSKNDKTDFEKDIDQLVEEINRNREHYKKHKVFLTNALKWERQNNNTSVLLRGHKLDEAKVWLKRGQKLSKYQPLPLHENFILESEAKSGNLETEVFVSYSRTDSDFARKLNEELQFNGKTTWFDQESIASGADFQQEIYRGIEGATNFLFVISPDAIQSPYCADEVEYAQKLGKRFITVLHRETDPSTLPPALVAVQWIDFVDKDFSKQFGEVIRTLDTDREYVRMHNVWQKEALQWQKSNKNKDYLLRGSSFALASAWLESADKEDKKPEPTALQREYLEKSEAAIFALQNKEKRTIQRLRGLLTVAVVALIALIGVGFYVYHLRNKALRLSEIADERRELAIKAAEKAKIAEAKAKEALKAADEAKQETSKALAQLRQNEKSLQKALSDALNSKNFAEAKRIEAELAENKAEQEKEKAVISQQLADTESKSNEKISTALQLTEKDPTYALHLAKQAYKNNSKPAIKEVVFSIHRNYSFYEKKITLHKKSIRAMAVSPTGLILTGSEDKTAKLINNKGEIIKEIKEHQNYVNTVAFSKDGKLFATGGGDKKARVWTKEGELITTVSHDNPITSIAFFPDSESFIVGDDESFVKIWDTKTGELITETDLSQSKINDIFVSNDGTKFVVATQSDATIFDLKTNQKETLDYDYEPIESLAISPNNKFLLTGSREQKKVRLWDLSDLSKPTLEIATDYVKSVNFSPNGQQIFAGTHSGSIYQWDLEGNPINTFRGHQDEVNSVKFIDGKMISSSKTSVILWKNEGGLIKNEKLYEDKINSISQNSITNHVLTASSDFAWKLHTADGKLIREQKDYDGELMATFSKDGKNAVIVSIYDKVEVWNTDLTQKKNTIEIGDKIDHVAISIDSKYVAFSTHARYTGGKTKNLVLLYELEGLKLIHTINQEERVTAITFHPTKHNKIGIADKKGNLGIWNISNYITKDKELNSLYPHSINFLEFFADGNYILVGGENKNAILSSLDGKVKANFQGHSSTVLSGGFSSDQKQIITSSSDRSIKIWDLEGNLIKTFLGHKNNVKQAIFSNDDRKIYSVDIDGNRNIWMSVESPLNGTGLYLPNASDLLSVGVEPSKEDLETATLSEIMELVAQYEVKLKEAGYEVEKYPIALKIMSLFDVASTKKGFDATNQEEYEIAYSSAINYGSYLDKKEELSQIAQAGIDKGFTNEYFVSNAFLAFLINDQLEDAEKIYKKYYKKAEWLDNLEFDISLSVILEIVTEKQERDFKKMVEKYKLEK